VSTTLRKRRRRRRARDANKYNDADSLNSG
jgi:hypothetical protein